MKDISDKNLIIETKIPAKVPVTHRAIAEGIFPHPQYRTACGRSLRKAEVKKVNAKEPTCGRCLKTGNRLWRFRRSGSS